MRKTLNRFALGLCLALAAAAQAASYYPLVGGGPPLPGLARDKAWHVWEVPGQTNKFIFDNTRDDTTPFRLLSAEATRAAARSAGATVAEEGPAVSQNWMLDVLSTNTGFSLPPNTNPPSTNTAIPWIWFSDDTTNAQAGMSNNLTVGYCACSVTGELRPKYRPSYPPWTCRPRKWGIMCPLGPAYHGNWKWTNSEVLHDGDCFSVIWPISWQTGIDTYHASTVDLYGAYPDTTEQYHLCQNQYMAFCQSQGAWRVYYSCAASTNETPTLTVMPLNPSSAAWPPPPPDDQLRMAPPRLIGNEVMVGVQNVTNGGSYKLMSRTALEDSWTEEASFTMTNDLGAQIYTFPLDGEAKFFWVTNTVP